MGNTCPRTWVTLLVQRKAEQVFNDTEYPVDAGPLARFDAWRSKHRKLHRHLRVVKLPGNRGRPDRRESGVAET